MDFWSKPAAQPFSCFHSITSCLCQGPEDTTRLDCLCPALMGLSPTLAIVLDPISVPSGLSVPVPAMLQQSDGFQCSTTLPSLDMGHAKPGLAFPCPLAILRLLICSLLPSPGLTLAHRLTSWPGLRSSPQRCLMPLAGAAPSLPYLTGEAPMATSALAPREMLFPIVS